MADPIQTRSPAESHSPVADKLVGKAKQVAGGVLGRDDLKNEGQLQQGRARAVRDAEVARQEAARATEAAAIEEQKHQLDLDRQSLETQRRRVEAEEAARRDEAQARAEARARAAQQERAVEAQDRETKKALDADERRAVEAARTAGQSAAGLEIEAEREARAADAVDPH